MSSMLCASFIIAQQSPSRAHLHLNERNTIESREQCDFLQRMDLNCSYTFLSCHCGPFQKITGPREWIGTAIVFLSVDGWLSVLAR